MDNKITFIQGIMYCEKVYQTLEEVRQAITLQMLENFVRDKFNTLHIATQNELIMTLMEHIDYISDLKKIAEREVDRMYEEACHKVPAFVG